ncbi:unnamed protein product [Discosporangium mesarthrocarpum]
MQVAEEYAKEGGGWTTSRHYSVPTTDLPMHKLSPLLPWFRSLLQCKLFPALAEQFGEGGGGEGARTSGAPSAALGGYAVHDAFVVRYEGGRQRHLPLHRDQSTHSFTVALNSTHEYQGGGTFFPCLGRPLRPEKGHVLSFRGSILHGGDPTWSGVRYIIACFVYALHPLRPLPSSSSVAATMRGDGSGTGAGLGGGEGGGVAKCEGVGLAERGSAGVGKRKGRSDGGGRNAGGSGDAGEEDCKKRSAIDFGSNSPSARGFAFNFGAA